MLGLILSLVTLWALSMLAAFGLAWAIRQGERSAPVLVISKVQAIKDKVVIAGEEIEVTVGVEKTYQLIDRATGKTVATGTTRA